MEMTNQTKNPTPRKVRKLSREKDCRGGGMKKEERVDHMQVDIKKETVKKLKKKGRSVTPRSEKQISQRLHRAGYNAFVAVCVNRSDMKSITNLLEMYYKSITMSILA